MTSIHKDASYWWDHEVFKMFMQHTTKKFKREAIWEVSWDELHKQINGGQSRIDTQDPRSDLDKLTHRWLKKTQPIHSKRWVKFIDRIFFWQQ